MKPFLGIDLTENKKNEQPNGAEFLACKPSAAMARSLETSSEKADAAIESAKLPKPLRIIGYICSIVTLLLVGGIVRASVSIEEGYRNAPALYWAAGICGFVWLILWLWGKQKSKTVLQAEESTQSISHFEGVVNAVYTEMAVPAGARDVDILSFYYKMKDGKVKVREKAMQMAPYLNPEYKIFMDSENLYLADLEGKYAFPRTAFVAIHTVKKHVRIMGWNKTTPMNKGIYTQYKLTADKYGCVHCNRYHILEISHNGQTCGIYFPCYELPVFEKLTGLQAQTAQKA